MVTHRGNISTTVDLFYHPVLSRRGDVGGVIISILPASSDTAISFATDDSLAAINGVLSRIFYRNTIVLFDICD